MGMLGTHTPAACLPKGAEIFGMVGSRLVALETIGEDGFLRAATKPLPKHSTRVGVFIAAIGWPLTSKDTGDMKARGREDSGRQRGTCPNEVREEMCYDPVLPPFYFLLPYLFSHMTSRHMIYHLISHLTFLT